MPEALAPLAVSQREMPHSLAAEQYLLGTVMARPEAVERIHHIVSADMFYDPLHARLWRDVTDRVASGQLADPVALAELYANQGVLDSVGGAEYLARLVGMMMPVSSLPGYAVIVRDTHMRREIIASAITAVERAFAPGNDGAQAIVSEAAGELMRIADTTKSSRAGPAGDAVADVIEAAARAQAAGKQMQGVRTGLGLLDHAVSLLQPSQFVVVAGRPGMGKTILGIKLATGIARQGLPVLVFSLEMDRQELGERIACEATGIRSEALRAGDMTQDEWDRLVAFRGEMAGWPLHIDDTPGLTVDEVRLRARSFQWRHGLAAVVVDHMSLLKAPRDVARHGKTQEVGYISTNLKRLAKELRVPLIALCQLNRANEAREDKRPGLADLRWAGEIEQDADIVGFIHREEHYLRQAEPRQAADEGVDRFRDRHDRWSALLAQHRGWAEFLIRKNRRGPEADLRLRVDLGLSRIWSEDMT